MCQLFLHPGSNVTFAKNNGASLGFVSGFKKDAPLKYSLNPSLKFPNPNTFSFLFLNPIYYFIF